MHHITGQGEDGGVVYCEMQEHESEMHNIVDWEFKSRMYPGSGYSAETGGRLNNLRTSTTHEKVCYFYFFEKSEKMISYFAHLGQKLSRWIL